MNSGTSADGLNAVLTEFKRGSLPAVLKSAVFPFDNKLSKKIIRCCEPDYNDGEAWLALDIELGKIMADRARKFLRDAFKQGFKVDLIASHGQTVRHLPAKMISLQLGDPATIASKTGLPVIADFGRSDIAAGGEGAPLSPLLHEYLFGHKKRWRAVVNIGGIANITILPSLKSRKRPFAADCGPGNMVIDIVMRRLYGKAFDKDGKIALSGKPEKKVVSRFLRGRFFRLPPPKSTGRELFGDKFVDRMLHDLIGSIKQDKIATSAEITAQSIARFIKKYASSVEEIFLCGGGSKNGYLVNRLAREFPSIKIGVTSELGYDPENIEAILWAYLAFQNINRVPVDTSRFTGAEKQYIPGALWLH